MTPAARVGCGILAGVAASMAVALVVGATMHAPAPVDRLVPEDASGHMHRIAIHYAPAMDRRALPIWRQLFRALPPDIEVEVAVTAPADFTHFLASLPGVDHLERFHAVVVDHVLTTWSRDRLAALTGPSGGAILAPPRIGTASGERAGDWDAPFAISRAIYHREPRIADYVFEGGDLAASSHHVFADINLVGRNLGRGDATREHLEGELAHTFAEDVVWLGDTIGEVPQHHIMMYMVPLDDTHVLVGDVRTGLGASVAHDPDVELMTARFDRVAALLAEKGFAVTRIPVVVLPGAGSYITYTNAVFDRDASGAKVVYLPTYDEPVLDAEAARVYESLGYRVVPIDVSSIYTLNGSLGCLVNVLSRD